MSLRRLTNRIKPSPPGPPSHAKRAFGGERGSRASDGVRIIVRLSLLLLALGLLALAGCGLPQPPEIATPGRVSLVFFYTDG